MRRRRGHHFGGRFGVGGRPGLAFGRGAWFGGEGISVPTAPSDISLSAEDFDEDTELGDIATISANGNPASTFSFVGSPGPFGISGNTLTLLSPLDYETNTSHVITIRADNGEGSPYDEEFTIIVNDVAEGGEPLLSTTLQTSLTHDGVTFTFFADQAMTTPIAIPVGSDVLGEPVVLSDQSFWADTDPPSFIQDGYVANGAELDPSGNAVDQGFDESIGAHGGGPNAATATTYNEAKNVAINGPVFFPAGENHSLVKTVRSANAVPGWNTIEKKVVLTVLAQRPRADLYRPSYANPNQPLQYKGDKNMTVFRSLTTPASGAISYATLSAYLDGIVSMWSGSSGEKLRRFVNDPAASSGYSADYGGPRAAPLYMLHSDAYDAAEEDYISDRVIREALDIWGAYQTGWTGSSGAGQHHGYHAQIFTTGFALGSQDMLDDCQSIRSNMLSHPVWIDQDDVGSLVQFLRPEGQLSRYADQFRDEDVGKPHWTEKDRGSQPTARYIDISMLVGATELFPLLLLQNGPGGITGYDAILNGGPNDTTNQRAAAIAIFDRALTMFEIEADVRAFRFYMAPEFFLPNRFYTDENWRGVVPLSRWTGVPEAIDYMAGNFSGADFFTPGAANGEIDYDADLPGRTASTLPITNRYVEYSLDGVQFMEQSVASRQGTLTGLLQDAKYYCRYSEANALGRGKPSYNWPASAYDDGQGNVDVLERNAPTVPGTSPASVPVNTVAPAIHYRPFPGWGGDDPISVPPGTWFLAAPSVLPADAVVLYAGVGDYDDTAGTPESFTYRWFRDGTPIVGAVSKHYALQVDDLDAEISCGVTPVNASGSGVETVSAAVSVPAAPVVPGQFNFRSDMQPVLPLYWPDVFASVVTTNATFKHDVLQPYVEETEPPVGVETSKGGIRADKTGSYPNININLAASRPLIPGHKYRVLAHIPISFGDSLTAATTSWAIRKDYDDGGTTYASGTFAIPTNPYVAIVDETITIDEAEPDPDLWFRVSVNSSSFGTAGGDPIISFVQVEDLDYVAPPASTVILETDFQSGWETTYPLAHASIYTLNATAVLEPSATYGTATSGGGVRGDKTGSYPRLAINIAADTPLTPGHRYRVIFHVAISYGDSPHNGQQNWIIRKNNTSDDYAAGADTDTSQHILIVDETIDVDGSEPDLDMWIYTSISTPTGGTIGGDNIITYARLEDLGPTP